MGCFLFNVHATFAWVMAERRQQGQRTDWPDLQTCYRSLLKEDKNKRLTDQITRSMLQVGAERTKDTGSTDQMYRNTLQDVSDRRQQGQKNNNNKNLTD